MTSRKPTNPPAKPTKPAVYPGDPGGTPMPKSLEGIETVNELIRQRSEANTAGANKQGAMVHAQRAVARVRELGRTPKIGSDELTETDIEYRGRRIHTTTADNRSWVMVGGVAEGSMRAAYDAVTLVPIEDAYGNSFSEVIYWAEVTKTELAEVQERADRENAEHAEIEASRILAKSIIAKAKRHPYSEHPPIKTGWSEITLDDVDEAMAKTQAKVVVVGSGTLIVHAARQDELLAAAAKLKNPPKFLAKQFAGYTNQVYELMHYLEVLGPLAVSWARTGKRPPSDVDAKQLANRVTTGGVFVH